MIAAPVDSSADLHVNREGALPAVYAKTQQMAQHNTAISSVEDALMLRLRRPVI